MKRRDARAAAARRRSARSRSLVGLGVGVLIASGTFDHAIKELTLPLRHEDVIRQQAAKRTSTRR